MKKLGAENQKPMTSICHIFVIIDERLGNTSDCLTMRYSKVFCGNKKLGSCVVLSSSDLGKDSKWNVVEASSERDIWSNHYAPSSLKSVPSLNHFNSKDKSAQDFVWETKSSSNHNSAWVAAVKKTEVTSNLEHCGGCCNMLEADGVRQNIKLEVWVMTIRKAS